MLQASLNRAFTSGASWPVDRGSLAAFVDMGLSDAQIAAFFSVEADEVLSLRNLYGFSRMPGR